MALVVLCLGLPNLLVACNEACCAGHVKLTTACEAGGGLTGTAVPEAAACSCCGVSKPSDAPDRERNAGDCGGCVHIALGVELAPPPRPATFDLDAVPMAAIAFDWVTEPPLAQRAALLPPSTGPPRCDGRTDLLATTVLLL